jgi:hypothetical protein
MRWLTPGRGRHVDDARRLAGNAPGDEQRADRRQRASRPE